MNREEASNCTVAIEEHMTRSGPRYRARLCAPQARAVIYETGWYADKDEADRRVRAYWRNLLGRISSNDGPFA